MSPASGPGPRSLEGLAWLARIGPASLWAWGAAMGWGERAARSHALRLEQAGLLARSRRIQGAGGALLYATGDGVAITGVNAAVVRRAPSAVSADHLEACAELAAFTTRRALAMRGPRELLADDEWSGQLEWRERGETRRRRHRPDLIVTGIDGTQMAFEVELHAKSPARLTAILRLYARWLADGRVSSIAYVVAGERERRQLRELTPRVGLTRKQVGIRDRAEIQADIYPQ